MIAPILTCELLTEECRNSKSFSQIAKKYGIDRHIISKYCYEYNIRPLLPKRRKYLVNDLFFNNATEKSFYWAGFIAADGCLISSNSEIPNALTIELSKKDKNLLQSFVQDIEFTGPIITRTTNRSDISKKYNNTDLIKISIYSNQIIIDLEKFNITSHKSLTLEFPKYVADHLLCPHFMRGYIDGDGCFYLDKKTHRITIIVLGTFNFLSDFSQVLQKYCNLSSFRSPRKIGNIYELRFYKQHDVKSIVNFLYKDCLTFLPRKYDIVKSLIPGGGK